MKSAEWNILPCGIVGSAGEAHVTEGGIDAEGSSARMGVSATGLESSEVLAGQNCQNLVRTFTYDCLTAKRCMLNV